MTEYMLGKVKFAVKWYGYSNEHYPAGRAVHRDELFIELTDLGIKAANKDMEADFYEISMLLDRLEKGEELDLSSLPEVAA
ncbi:hypothetical protein ACEQ3E_001173 [Salmonella enterica]|uniref:Uncharacterized protein n=1 Tax=Salmonella enterica TaxID=28901 RepID=A0A5T5VXV2_SALER|nr:hypothetical protein [Salmonella enterica]ECC3880488.1 hypothetical protein [Salmonella enterica subsp. diarizonae]ECU5461103.1 hypothetical protein [Salmonella enterica subsp. enterica serovar Muenchen]EDS4380194.1 hypothetical protein [Salmonella enterica subsp. diarizonae serovar 16:z10:e,n,x,z15]EBA5979582.1 hypothetical protein [Salmonella enterica]